MLLSEDSSVIICFRKTLDRTAANGNPCDLNEKHFIIIRTREFYV